MPYSVLICIFFLVSVYPLISVLIIYQILMNKEDVYIVKQLIAFVHSV